MKTVQIKNTPVPHLGQGTWKIGENPAMRQSEISTLRWGIENGLTLIDTAEMYGDGASEELIGEAIKSYTRKDLYLVSKVYPWNAGGSKLQRSCQDSLERLGTDYLNLYLLHWPGSIPLAETVQGLEKLKAEGKIKNWGVSNFDFQALQKLLAIPGGENCAAIQNLYHLGSRGADFELLPFLEQHQIAFMAYCPLAQAGRLQRDLLRNVAVRQIAEKYNITEYQVLLTFVLAKANVIAIPKASTVQHVKDNRAVADFELTSEDLAFLDGAYPTPTRRLPLDLQ